jgi:hypothetical protein
MADLDGGFARGDLGPEFNGKEVCCVPALTAVLDAKQADMLGRDEQYGAVAGTKAFELVKGVQDYLTQMADMGARDAAELFPAGAPRARLLAGGADELVELKAYELALAATLLPHSVEEAVALIPSLAMYNPADLDVALAPVFEA